MFSMKNTNNKKNTGGLTRADLVILHKVFGSIPSIKQVILFGSRALGTFEKGSDIDLALRFKQGLDGNVVEVTSLLNDTLLPYFFDVITMDSITSPELQEHIKKHGIVLYNNS